MKNLDAYEIDSHDELLEYLNSEIKKMRLHTVIRSNAPSIVTHNIPLKAEGQEEAMENKNGRKTVLHYALQYKVSAEVVSRLIEKGGHQIVMSDYDRSSTLHYALEWKASSDVISKLLEFGGKEIIMKRNVGGETALHHACKDDANSIELISKLLEIGGQEIVVMKDIYGLTALHYACSYKASIEVISKILDIGRKKIAMEKDNNGFTVLHHACRYKYSIEVISKLLEVGRTDILVERDHHGYTASHYSYFNINDDAFGDCTLLCLKEGILANIGGEFGIGGLFDVTLNIDDRQRRIYKQWNRLSPLLEIAITSIDQQLPILHAAIIDQAPRNIIREIIERFYCVLTKDSFERYPIDVAIIEGYEWSEGMQDVIKATAEAMQRHMIDVAAQYGLKWSNNMKELVQSHIDKVVHGYDELTGLRPFMLAAIGDHCDLSSIYGMMRKGPEIKITE